MFIPLLQRETSSKVTTTLLPYATLLRSVTNSRENPIIGAIVSFDEQQAISDEYGSFTFYTSKADTYRLDINIDGNITFHEVTIEDLIENRNFTIDGAKITGTILDDWSNITIFDASGRIVFEASSIDNSFSSNLLPLGEYVISAANSDNSKALLEAYSLHEDSLPINTALTDASIVNIYFSDKSYHSYTLFDSYGMKVNPISEYLFESFRGLLLIEDAAFITTSDNNLASITEISKTGLTIINPIKSDIFFIDDMHSNPSSVSIG